MIIENILNTINKLDAIIKNQFITLRQHENECKLITTTKSYSTALAPIKRHLNKTTVYDAKILEDNSIYIMNKSGLPTIYKIFQIPEYNYINLSNNEEAKNKYIVVYNDCDNNMWKLLAAATNHDEAVNIIKQYCSLQLNLNKDNQFEYNNLSLLGDNGELDISNYFVIHRLKKRVITDNAYQFIIFEI